MKTNILHFCIISRSFLYRIRHVSDNSFRENLCSVIFFSFENGASSWDNVKKLYSRAGHILQCGVYACMLDTWSYKYTLRICTTCYFSTAIIFIWTRLNIRFYVHGLATGPYQATSFTWNVCCARMRIK